MPAKLTNEIIDDRLKDRNIKRLEDFINCHTKIAFQCLKECCQFIWRTKPYILFNGSGCPNCVKKMRLTNELIDERLKDRPIKRIGDCLGTMTKITFQCLKNNCNNIWKARPNNILDQNQGCPKCGGTQALSNEVIDERLVGKNIKRISNYVNSTTKIICQCLDENCNYTWAIRPPDATKGNCAKCSGRILLTNELIDEKLKNRDIKRIGDYIDVMTKIDFQCLNEDCQYVWEGSVNNIINNESGCPKCARGKNEKLVGTFLKNNNVIFEEQKNIRKINNYEERKILVDFYLPQINTIIEYNGHQHYQPVCFGGMDKSIAEYCFIKQQERDQYLQKFCNQNGIQLIWIDGRKYTNSKLKHHLLNDVLPKLKLVA